MQDNCRTIFAECRRYAGLSQERAAEALNLDTRRLRNYERGENVPPADIVRAMAVLYQNKWLAVQNDILYGASSIVLPDIEKTDLSKAFLSWHLGNKRLAAKEDRMMEIAAEGIVQKASEAEWNMLMDEVREQVKAGLELMCVN